MSDPIILFTSDWQAHLQNLPRCEQALEHMLEVADREQVTHIVNLGDVKDAFNPVDQRVTNFLVDMTHRIIKDYEFIVLAGNHDHIGVSDVSPTCLPVMKAAGAKTVESPYTTFTKPALQFIPFYRDNKAFEAALLPPGQRRNTILCFHQDLLGSRHGHYASKEGVDVALLEGYKLAIGGHIHTPQHNGHVYYVGSPFCQDWGEVNQQKRFLLWKDGKLTSISCTVPGWHDPTLHGYLPKVWTGCKVRLTYDHTDPKLLQKQYPGAELVIVPEKANLTLGGAAFDPGASDHQLIRDYLGGDKITAEAKPLVPYLSSKLKTVASPNSRINFREVTGESVLCFEKVDLQLDFPGVTLVTGINKDWGDGRSNGSGKSSLLGLPLLALFGETTKGQKHDEWGQRDSSTTSKVSLTLDTSEGIQHISRRRRPGALEYTVAGKVHTMGSPVETQRLIEATTRLRWDVVVNSMYIGQQEVATLLAGTNKERKELFGRFLGLDRFLVATQAVRDDLRKVERWVMEVEAFQTTSQTLIAHLKSKVEAFEVKESAKEIQAKNDAITIIINKTQSKLDELQTLATVQEMALRGIREKQIKASVEVATLIERERQCVNEVIRINELKGVCPVCEQPIKKELFADRLGEAQKQRVEAGNRLTVAREKHKKQNQDYQAQEQQVEDSQTKLSSLQAQVRQQEREYQANQRKLDQATQREELQQDLAKEKRKERLHSNALIALRKDVELLKAAIKVVSRDGLPAFLGTTVCPRLQQAGQYYSSLFSQGEIQVHFLVNEGEVDITIENKHGGKTITDQSQGERRMAGLIAAFAIREVLAPYNILILDEPGEGLDSHNATIFAQALQEVASRFGSLYLTTHNPFILAGLKPDRHLELTKENGISTLMEVG